MPGLVRAGEVGPDPGDPDLAGLLGLTCGCGQGRPVDRGAPAAGEPGVDLELHPGSGSLLLGRTGDLAELVERSEEHTSELQSLMRISYAVFCLKKKNKKHIRNQ